MLLGVSVQKLLFHLPLQHMRNALSLHYRHVADTQPGSVLSVLLQDRLQTVKPPATHSFNGVEISVAYCFLHLGHFSGLTGFPLVHAIPKISFIWEMCVPNRENQGILSVLWGK